MRSRCLNSCAPHIARRASMLAVLQHEEGIASGIAAVAERSQCHIAGHRERLSNEISGGMCRGPVAARVTHEEDHSDVARVALLEGDAADDCLDVKKSRLRFDEDLHAVLVVPTPPTHRVPCASITGDRQRDLTRPAEGRRRGLTKFAKKCDMGRVAEWRTAGMSPEREIEPDDRTQLGDAIDSRFRSGAALEPGELRLGHPCGVGHHRLAQPKLESRCAHLAADRREGRRDRETGPINSAFNGRHAVILKAVASPPLT